MLIQGVYEVAPLSCPQCGGKTTVVAFVEPPQTDVVEGIFRGYQSRTDHRFALVPVGTQSTTERRWFGPKARFGFFRPIPRPDLRRHEHISVHLIIITDAGWPGTLRLSCEVHS